MDTQTDEITCPKSPRCKADIQTLVLRFCMNAKVLRIVIYSFKHSLLSLNPAYHPWRKGSTLSNFVLSPEASILIIHVHWLKFQDSAQRPFVFLTSSPHPYRTKHSVLLAFCMLLLQYIQVLTAGCMTATCMRGTQQALNECSLNEMFMHETVGFLNRAAMPC